MAKNIVEFVAQFNAKTSASFKKAVVKIDELKKKIAEIKKKKLELPVSTQTTTGISSLTKQVGALALAVGGFESVKSFLGLGIQAEQVSAQYTVLLGSASKAKEKIAELNKFASNTPLSPTEVLKSGKSLIAMGVNVDDLITKQRMLGDIALASGKNFGELSAIYGKASAGGLIQADELNQITDAGIPIMAELAKVLGTTAKKVKKMGSDGKISFNDLDKAFQQLTATGGRYAGMMETMSKTTAGRWTKLTGSVRATLTTLSEKFRPMLNKVVDSLTKMWEWMTKNTKILKIVAWSVGIVTVAYGAYVVATAIATTTTTAFGIAMAVLNVILTLNPIGLVVAGIVLLVGGLILAWKKSEKFRQVMHGLWEVLKLVLSKIFAVEIAIGKRLVKAWTDNKEAIMGWIKIAKDTVKDFAKLLKKYIFDIIDGVMKKWQDLKDMFSKSDIGKQIIGKTSNLKKEIVDAYNKGVKISKDIVVAKKTKVIADKVAKTTGKTGKTGTKTPTTTASGISALKSNVDTRAKGVTSETKNISIKIENLGNFEGATISTDNIADFETQLTQALMRVANSINTI